MSSQGLYDALLSCTRFSSVAGRRRDNSTQTDLLPILEKPGADVDPQNRQSSLETALQLVQRAVTADKGRRYEDALQLYQHALVYFLESINYETESEKVKEKILSKCKQYLDRAEKISEYLNSCADQRKRRPSYMGSKGNLSNSTGDVSRTGSTDSTGSTSPSQTRKNTIANSVSHFGASVRDSAVNTFGPGPGGGLGQINLAMEGHRTSMSREYNSVGAGTMTTIDKAPNGPLGRIYATLSHNSAHSIKHQSSSIS